MIDRLEFYLDIVDKSLNDLKKYKEKIDIFLPIDNKSYEDLQNQKEILDAIAFRFNKIQPLLGEKIFKLFLEKVGYDTQKKTFLEILSELEKLNILKRKDWVKLREIRNRITHEYPEEIDEIIENLNQIIENISYLETIITKIKEKIEIRK